MRPLTETLTWARFITNDTDLRALHGAWHDLLARSAADSIFLTPEWTEAWLYAYGAGDGLRTLAVYRGDRLIGIAPLVVRRAGLREFPMRVRVCFATDGSADSDYLDIIAARGEEGPVVDTVMAAVADLGDRWQALALNEVPKSSATLEVLRVWLDTHGWFIETQNVPCARVELPETWDAYLKSLKPRMRTKIRSLLKKADNDPEITFDRCTNDGDLPERLESLYALHQSRWEMRGQSGIFEEPAKRAFYERMSQDFLAAGWLRFYSLSWRGAYIAHQFCFERGGTMSLLQEGFDKAWADAGVGNMLRALVLRDSIRRGVAVYDFLAGVTSHKLAWGAYQTQNLRILTAPPGPRSATYAGVRQTWRWGKDLARRVRACTINRPARD